MYQHHKLSRSNNLYLDVDHIMVCLHRYYDTDNDIMLWEVKLNGQIVDVIDDCVMDDYQVDEDTYDVMALADNIRQDYF